MSKVSKEQVQEWTENPVTEALKDLILEEIEKVQSTPVTDCLVFGEPDKTHENLVNLEAREAVFQDLAAFLGGDWEYFMEEESVTETGYEFIGDHSQR